MPAPLPLPLRRLIERRADRGQSAAAIARALHLCPRTVRQLLQGLRQQGWCLEPAYRPGPGRPADHPLYAQALALRQQHPTWGAGYIRVRLAALAEAAVLPSERTLQRWFRRQGQLVAPPGRRTPAEAGRATAAHDTWQMDAVEQLRLGSGQGVCWLRLVDECSGAFLGTTVFPPLPLGARRRGGRARAAAGRLCPLGAAAPPARGQRQAVGVVE
jgi:transposase